MINLIPQQLLLTTKEVFYVFHFQLQKPIGYIISVIEGTIYDVAVDLRKTSGTFGLHASIKLSEKSDTQIYVPPGFAHGFCCLEKENYIIYSCTQYRHASSERSIKYNDKTILEDVKDFHILIHRLNTYLKYYYICLQIFAPFVIY